MSFAGQKKGTRGAIEQRIRYREQWLHGALDATKDCDIVFFDPDNGLEVKSTAFHQDKGAKFTFYRELLPFWERGQSLVIYQHATRKSRVRHIFDCVKKLEENFPSASINYVHFSGGSGRIFFVVTHKLDIQAQKL